MGKIIKGLIVTLCGVATTILTAAGLVYLELRYDFAFYGLVYAFVFPFGAMLSGLVAASGYYLGARLANYRPGRGMLLVMLAVSGANFFLIYWLKFIYTTVDGSYVHDSISFPAYLAYSLTHTSIKGQYSAEGFELGLAGYLYAAALIVGFAIGGWIVYGILRAAAYCENCRLFMDKMGSQTRYFRTLEEVSSCNTTFKSEVAEGRFRQAMQLHARDGAALLDEAKGYSSVVKVRQCKECGRHRGRSPSA